MRALVAGLAAGTLLLAGCTSGPDPRPTSDPSPTGRSGLDAALSRPVEDRVYPQVGDPGVDALHYDLDLTWTPATSTLDAVETLVLRATSDADHVQLDLEHALAVSSVRVDGREVLASHDGKDLVVHTPVRADRRYTLVLRYAGSPEPVAAPTTRSDFSTLGWTTTRQGGVWTMQEPFGAYSWYAVNDQPSDKALYDFTISAPSPMVGVANGTLESRHDDGGTTVTRWHLDDPAASYLTTIAIGDFRETRDRSASGVPVTYWTPTDRPDLVARMRPVADQLGWIEDRLGPYPFPSLGVVVVDSRSGMETQTMITLGRTAYDTSPEVLVHEMVHQWYGDEVTPADWRDVWMSEGMAMYLQGLWQAQRDHAPARVLMARWARAEPLMRREYGPPADYDPESFGAGNVYYGPALMWDQLRRRLGDQRFWSIARAWPAAYADANASYADIAAFWSRRAGEDLRPVFDAWLLGKASPPT